MRKRSLDVKNKVWDSHNRRGLKYEIWLFLEARNWVTDGYWLQTFHWLLKGGRTTTSTSMWTMPCTTPYLTLPSIFTSSGGYHLQNSKWFDRQHLVYRRVGLDPQTTLTPRGFMVTNSCSFTAPAAYPDVYMAGLAVEGLGNSSVRSVASVLRAFGCIEPFQVSSWIFPPHRPLQVLSLRPCARPWQGRPYLGQVGRFDDHNWQFDARLCRSWIREANTNTWTMEGRSATLDAWVKQCWLHLYQLLLHFTCWWQLPPMYTLAKKNQIQNWPKYSVIPTTFFCALPFGREVYFNH